MTKEVVEWGIEYNLRIGDQSDRTILKVDDKADAIKRTTGKGWFAREGIDGKPVSRTVTYSDWEENND